MRKCPFSVYGDCTPFISSMGSIMIHTCSYSMLMVADLLARHCKCVFPNFIMVHNIYFQVLLRLMMFHRCKGLYIVEPSSWPMCTIKLYWLGIWHINFIVNTWYYTNLSNSNLVKILIMCLTAMNVNGNSRYFYYL